MLDYKTNFINVIYNIIYNINFENRGQNWSVIFHSCVENFAEDIKSSEKAN